MSSETMVTTIDTIILLCIIGYWQYKQHNELVKMETTLDRIEGLVDKLGKR